MIEIDKDDHKSLVNLAILKDRLGKWGEAIKHLEEAVVIKGATDRKIHTNLGIIKRKEGKLQEGQNHIEIALEISELKKKDKDKDLMYINRVVIAKESNDMEKLSECL